MDQSATKAGRPTRRRALLGGGATLLLASVAARELSPAESDGSAGSDPAKATDKGAEAPMLADRVKAGELPEVGERLPGEPLVIEPTESIGTYGGTWRAWMEGQSAGHRFVVMIGYDNLVRWDPDGSQLPYLDEVTYELLGDVEVALLKTTNGELDFNSPRSPTSC